MPNYQLITLRAFMAYFALFIMTRLMGKREISQLTYFDYVVGIGIGTIAGSLAIDTSKGFLNMLPALLVFGFLQIIISFISLKSKAIRRIAEGKPTILIRKGEILEDNLAKARLNVDELLVKLREKNAFNIADVEYAILEIDGKLSVQKRPDKQPLTPSDINSPGQYTGIGTILIEEGKINEDKLMLIGLTKTWLLNKLKEQGIVDISKVMLAQVDEGGNLYVDLKEE